ncbi:MAG: peptidylprolyl isomerase [Planctomycetota bacterium]
MPLYQRFCPVLIALVCFTLLNGCQGLQTEVYRPELTAENGEPAYITIQHCLISFAGADDRVNATRSQEEAEQLANELLEKAKAGEDFGKIIRRNTDDSPPGIYRLANHGFETDKSSVVMSKNIAARSDMVSAFGDVGFSLKVDEFGMANYDPNKSPFGWHIIKRIR